MTDGDRRREVVRKWRESIAAQEAAKAPQSAELADARRVSDPGQRAKVAEIILANLAANVERYRQTPCVLSDAARATMGLQPLQRATEDAE